MKTNPAHSRIASIPKRIAQATILFIITSLSYVAYTDYVGTLTNRIFLDPESIPVVADGYQMNDVISYIAESTPVPGNFDDIGAGAWNTLYVPLGVVVVGAEIVEANGDGTYSAILAPQVAPIKDGCGGRGCAFPLLGSIQNGKLNEGQQDSGIFYSIDDRTDLLSTPYAVNPTGSGNQEAWNLWDAQQVRAFGGKADIGGSDIGALSDNGGQGNTPLVDMGTFWAGSGSPVAGPDTYFTNDYAPITCPTGSNDETFDDGDIRCVGPWNRITYMGDTIGGSGAVTPVIVDGTENKNTSVDTSTGVTLSEAFPLSSDTNAVRYVMGKRVTGDLETIRITFKITDPGLFTASLMNDSFCYDATGGDLDKGGVTGRGAQDNIWRYYEGSNHTCFSGTTDAIAVKSLLTVQGNPSPGSASDNDILGYEMTFTNTGSMPLYDINITDAPTTPELLLIAEGASLLCPYPTYAGDATGGTPTLNTTTAPFTPTLATWNELPVLGQGETVTVHICAQVTGAGFGDPLRNELTVKYKNNPMDLTETTQTSVAQIVVSTVISGAVYLDPNSSGYPTTAGDTGIAGVVVELYSDDNNNGLLDTGIGGDTYLGFDTTNTSGSYSFIGEPNGNYLVVETGLADLLSTGDKDNPLLANCALGNGCDVIAFNLNGSSTLNDFMNVGASIGDLVWDDVDGDGTLNGAEIGINGVTVDLYDDVNGNGVLDDGVDILLNTQTTAGGGGYDFTALPPGNYIVDVTDTANVLSEYVITTTLDTLPVTVLVGQDYNDADFGYQKQADLFITKDDGSTTYTPGTDGTYTIVVGNKGPANVVNAIVGDTFPLGVTLRSDINGDIVTCVATGSASCTASIGAVDDMSFTDSAINISADPTGTTNFVTYTVRVKYSSDMADYTP